MAKEQVIGVTAMLTGLLLQAVLSRDATLLVTVAMLAAMLYWVSPLKKQVNIKQQRNKVYYIPTVPVPPTEPAFPNVDTAESAATPGSYHEHRTDNDIALVQPMHW